MALNRFQPIKFDENSKSTMKNLQKVFCILEKMILDIDMTRDRGVALQRLEETYMWTAKSVRAQQIMRDVKNKETRH